jgi:polyketide synthase PksM
MEKLEVFKKCSPVMWSYIRHSNSSVVNKKITKLDIDLCDENGNVCVRITGMSGRVLEGKARDHEKQADSNIPVGNIMMAPVWNEFAIENGEPFAVDRVVIAEERKRLGRISESFTPKQVNWKSQRMILQIH